MKRSILLATTLLLAGCGANQQDELNKLLAQRDALNTHIEQLQQQIAGENGATQSGKIPNVQVQQIQAGRFQHFIKIQGTAESDNNILIPAQSSGVVKKIHVREGQWVHKDQLLAELDGVILENTLSELEVNLTLARTVYERQNRLWEKNIGSEVQYLQAKTTMEALEKRMATVKEQYQLTKITAPIDGTVDEILLKEGEAAGAGYGTIRVVNPTDLKISANLSEKYMGKVRVGDSVKIEFPVSGVQFTSRIRAVSQVINSQNRTFPIEVALPRISDGIKPNMLAVLTINDYENPQALAVPVNVVQKTGDSYFLFVASAQTPNSWHVAKRTIQPGLNYENQVEVLTGLQSQEYVVTQGFQDLADLQEVKVIPDNEVLATGK
jgi:RND family efflux transporter MFP subunit